MSFTFPLCLFVLCSLKCCCVISIRGLDTLGRFSAISTICTTSVTSCLHSCTLRHPIMGPLKGTNLPPLGSTSHSYPLEKTPFQKGGHNIFDGIISLKEYLFLLISVNPY